MVERWAPPLHYRGGKITLAKGYVSGRENVVAVKQLTILEYGPSIVLLQLFAEITVFIFPQTPPKWTQSYPPMGKPKRYSCTLVSAFDWLSLTPRSKVSSAPVKRSHALRFPTSSPHMVLSKTQSSSREISKVKENERSLVSKGTWGQSCKQICDSWQLQVTSWNLPASLLHN